MFIRRKDFEALRERVADLECEVRVWNDKGWGFVSLKAVVSKIVDRLGLRIEPVPAQRKKVKLVTKIGKKKQNKKETKEK